MEDQNNSGQGKFFNGFLLGLLVGAFVVLVLGTKKGKRLLKAISEKGLDNFSNILEEANEKEGQEEKPKKVFTPKREFTIKERSVEEKPKIRRFFRGISRRALN